jgi:hypothetical protein
MYDVHHIFGRPVQHDLGPTDLGIEPNVLTRNRKERARLFSTIDGLLLLSSVKKMLN